MRSSKFSRLSVFSWTHVYSSVIPTDRVVGPEIMGKTDTGMLTRRQKKALSDENNINNEGQTKKEVFSPSNRIAGTEEDAPTESTDNQKKDQDEQDSQVDAVIEVKGSTSTVTVSWEKEEEADRAQNRISGDDEMTTKKSVVSKAKTQADSADTMGHTDGADNGSSQTNMEQEMEDIKDESELKMDITEESGSTPTDNATCEKNEEVKSNHTTQEDNGGNGKRKVHPNVEISPSKKAKLINEDGFCLYVGNLNNSKTSEEITDSIANYFMSQSLLVQNIRLDSSKKHAYVNLTSEMDFTKALTLNGEKILDKSLKIAKAQVKSEDTVTVPPLGKTDKDARCLRLKNVPCSATTTDIQEIFSKAIDVRFPGGTKGPSKGVAFVEFESKTMARKAKKEKRGAKIQDQVLIMEIVGKKIGIKSSKVNKAKGDNNNNTKVPPNNILYVSNLSANATETHLKKRFKKAITINIRENEDKSRRFAFVKFATVAHAEKALQSSQNTKICKRTIRVKFSKMREKSENAEVQSQTLIVTGLSEKTTAETLKSAFEEAVRTRVAVDKDTGISKRFGFVDFENNEICKAVKEALEDCEIDGRKVNLAYAKAQSVTCPQGAKGAPMAGKRGQRRRGRRGPPNNILFVGNLSANATESQLKKVFRKALNINIPQSRGYAFVEFATVEDAGKALRSSQNMKICERAFTVDYAKIRESATVQSKTLIVTGLAAKTTADTLRSAFEGAVSTRVAVDKDTGVSKRFGFVDFDNERICKAFKEAIHHCKIDGCIVTLAYAKAKSERGHQAARGDGDPVAGQEGARGSDGRRSRRGKGHRAGKVRDADEEAENKP